jgi:hypothetical protein
MGYPFGTGCPWFGWKRLLRAFGRIVGLLFVEGDPRGVLFRLTGRIKNLHFSSRSVRSGFCQVVDCNAFDNLFAYHDLPDVLALMRGGNVIKRFTLGGAFENQGQEPQSSATAADTETAIAGITVS